MSVNTVKIGMREAKQPVEESLDPSRVWAKGGGRKPLTELDPGLLPALDALIELQTRGDPMSPLRWTSKSTEKLATAAAVEAQAAAARQHSARLGRSGVCSAVSCKNKWQICPRRQRFPLGGGFTEKQICNFAKTPKNEKIMKNLERS